MRALSVILIITLVFFQGQLWFGKGGLPRGAQLRAELVTAQAANEQARARNAQLSAELRDLKEGQEMVEEKARMELGMIKPDEIYVQVQR
ncbi:MAG TPA: cell division protein FtsB [Burkholderiaceae bacterium]